jgi:hypothetical protein
MRGPWAQGRPRHSHKNWLKLLCEERWQMCELELGAVGCTPCISEMLGCRVFLNGRGLYFGPDPSYLPSPSQNYSFPSPATCWYLTLFLMLFSPLVYLLFCLMQHLPFSSPACSFFFQISLFFSSCYSPPPPPNVPLYAGISGEGEYGRWVGTQNIQKAVPLIFAPSCSHTST